jgi:signal transduction histidine kinase
MMSRILVVEDEAPVRANLVELLEAEGFEVLEAADGLAGVRVASEQVPDLVVCDVMMPGLDGHGVLAELRRHPATAAVPFIFLTARADRVDMRTGMNLGADDYLSKPFSRDELLSALETRLGRHAAVARAGEARLDDLRNNITRSVPHELLTPLNGILGFAGLLLEVHGPDLPLEAREMLAQINSSAVRLENLLQNFILFFTLEMAARQPGAPKAREARAASSVRSTVGPAASAVAQRLGRSGDLAVDLDEGEVRLDDEYLEKVAGELVENALKFSPPGSGASVHGRAGGRGYLLSVTDRGRGMTAAQLAAIGPYIQFDRARYEQQGLGLGLAICRRIVESCGGTLEIESVPGEGTTVLVALPIAS